MSDPTTIPAGPTSQPANREADDAKGDASAPGAAGLRDKVIEQLRTVFDPEIPVNIYELGLIYEVSVDAEGAAKIVMTLTTPMCPAAEELPPEVESKARSVEGVSRVELDLVWDPPWSPDMMSEAARLELGMV
jgi:FeS assembly SUF system protein